MTDRKELEAQFKNAAKELSDFYRDYGVPLKEYKDKEKKLRNKAIDAATPLLNLGDRDIVAEEGIQVFSSYRPSYSLKKLEDLEGSEELYLYCCAHAPLPSSVLELGFDALEIPAEQHELIKKQIESSHSITYTLKR